MQDSQSVDQRSTRANGTAVRKSIFVLALLLVSALNLVLASSQRSDRPITLDDITSSAAELRQEGSWPWWITRSYLMQPRSPDIVLLGSSQMASAVFATDAHTLQRDLDIAEYREGTTLERHLQSQTSTPVSVFNWSIGGEMVSDAYMIAHTLFQGDKKPKLVVIGIGPRDFMDNTLITPSTTEEFQFFAPFVELGELGPAAFNEPLARMNWEINERLPLRRWSQGILQRCNQSLLTAAFKLRPLEQAEKSTSRGDASTLHKQFLQAISGGNIRALPGSLGVRKGQWIIPYVTGSLFLDNTAEYKRRFAQPNPPIYKGERQFFSAFLKEMQQRHIQVLVIGMPSLTPNRQLLPDTFWQDFHQFIATQCQEYGADWLDLSASPLFITNYFLDTVHMNFQGGEQLFRVLAEKIAQTSRLIGALQTDSQRAQISNSKEIHTWF